MLRKLAILALAVGLGGCGTEDDDKQVLTDFVQQLKKLDGKYKQRVSTIEHL